MKKYLLFLIIILLFSYKVEAIDLKNLEINGGLNYNNYLYKKYNLDKGIEELDNDYFIREDLHEGTGYYTELIYWINKQIGLGLGVQKTEMAASWNSETGSENYYYQIDLDTYYSTLNYKLNSTLNLYIDLNYNNYLEHYSKTGFSTKIKSGNGLGMMVGAKVHYQLNQNIDFSLNTGYYLAEIEIDQRYSSYHGQVIAVDDEILEISGLGLKLGVNYKF